MKKALCLLLSTLMITSVVACNTIRQTPDDTQMIESIDTSGNEVADQTQKEEFVPSYTGVFKVGYDRQDISPEGDIYLENGTHVVSVLDPIYATCIAVNDGENTALIFTIDIQNLTPTPYLDTRKCVSQVTGVPVDNIVISTTHTHSGPEPGLTWAKTVNVRWELKFYRAVQKAAQNAIADLSDAEIHIGSTLAKDMSFVRRWYLSDGTPSGIWRQNYSRTDRVSYESDSDDLCQLIRFVREDKKDVLLASWGIHFGRAIQAAPSKVSADINAYLRSVTEELDEDVLFAFYLAPSGNIGFGPYIDGIGTYYSYVRMAKDLAKQIIDEMDNLTRVNAGKISTEVKTYSVEVRKNTSDVVEKAKKAYEEIGSVSPDEQYSDACYEISAKYGFESYKDVVSTINRNKETRGKYDDIMLTALSFGDIGFAGVPYEMFDTNGMELREASPFKVTIVMTGCGGSWGYVPSALAVPNGGYEVYTSPWEFGTAEKIVGELVNMLKAQKK